MSSLLQDDPRIPGERLAAFIARAFIATGQPEGDTQALA
jgi:hypothetical protein